MNDLKSRVLNAVDKNKEKLFAISDWLKANPEIGHREYRTSWLLSSVLEREDFILERNVAGMETAFKALCRGRKSHPSVALLAELDALPGVGHGCGHNVIATSALGAALALKEVMPEVGGTLIVLGCPAEEFPTLPSSQSAPHKHGGKVILVEEGVFDDIDFAMMIHLAREGYSYMRRSRGAATTGLHISFVRSPMSEGFLLDAVSSFSNYVASLNSATMKDSKAWIEMTHPTSDCTEVGVRLVAPSVSTLLELSSHVVLEADKIAAKTGVLMYFRYFMNIYADMIWNNVLSEAFKSSLIELGDEPQVQIDEAHDRPCQSDVGNVSHFVPTICTWIKSTKSIVPAHSTDFAEATTKDLGHESILLSAKALAMTSIDIFTNAELAAESLSEFVKVSPSRSAEISLKINRSAE